MTVREFLKGKTYKSVDVYKNEITYQRKIPKHVAKLVVENGKIIFSNEEDDTFLNEEVSNFTERIIGGESGFLDIVIG